MDKFTYKISFTLITLCLLSIGRLNAGELEELIDLKKDSLKELAMMKAAGKGDMHPQILTKEEQIIEIEAKISALKDSHEEIVILLKGRSSLFMKGHPKYQKTETALPSLLLQGWKIKSIIPAGEQQAYIWLTRE